MRNPSIPNRIAIQHISITSLINSSNPPSLWALKRPLILYKKRPDKTHFFLHKKAIKHGGNVHAIGNISPLYTLRKYLRRVPGIGTRPDRRLPSYLFALMNKLAVQTSLYPCRCVYVHRMCMCKWCGMVVFQTSLRFNYAKFIAQYIRRSECERLNDRQKMIKLMVLL